MTWYYTFLFGVVAGIMFLLLAAGDVTGLTVQFPDYHWNLDLMKRVLSLFIVTVLMTFFFWYYA